jgi:hypothetical protein
MMAIIKPGDEKAEIARRKKMLTEKVTFCIYCGKPGTPGTIGEFCRVWMVGPGSPSSQFSGDPTGTEYFGSGANAHVIFHLTCVTDCSR